MTRPPAFQIWSFLMKNRKSLNSAWPYKDAVAISTEEWLVSSINYIHIQQLD